MPERRHILAPKEYIMEFRRSKQARLVQESFRWSQENAAEIEAERNAYQKVDEYFTKLLDRELHPGVERTVGEHTYRETTHGHHVVVLVQEKGGDRFLYLQSMHYPFVRRSAWVVDIPPDAYDLFPSNCTGSRCYIESDFVGSNPGPKTEYTSVRYLVGQIEEFFAPELAAVQALQPTNVSGS